MLPDLLQHNLVCTQSERSPGLSWGAPSTSCLTFCFGGHKPGDTAIVYGESGSYAGYHVVYYVGEGPLYSNYIAKSELQSNAMSDWTSELNEACAVTEGFGFRFVGK